MKVIYYSDELIDFFDDLNGAFQNELADIKFEKVDRGPIALGLELNEVIIYVTENKTPLLIDFASGVVGSVFWEMIKLVWNKVSVSTFKYLQSGIVKNRKGSIALFLQINKEQEVEFKLSGEVDQDLIPDILEKLKDFVINKQSSVLQNEKDYGLKVKGKIKYRVKYDEVNKVWNAIKLDI